VDVHQDKLKPARLDSLEEAIDINMLLYLGTLLSQERVDAAHF